MSYVLGRKETVAYNSFDDRFPESPNITIPEFPPEVIVILPIGLDNIYAQLLCRGEGWCVMDPQY